MYVYGMEVKYLKEAIVHVGDIASFENEFREVGAIESLSEFLRHMDSGHRTVEVLGFSTHGRFRGRGADQKCRREEEEED